MAPNILVICGPTASGKTALAVELALLLGGEVVSADSMQIYRGMDIGTAKPTAQERALVPHHMLDVADPTEAYAVAEAVTMSMPAAQVSRSFGVPGIKKSRKEMRSNRRSSLSSHRF